MNFRFTTPYFSLICLLFIVACNPKKNTTNDTKKSEEISKIKYAKGFEIKTVDGEKKLIIKSPYPNATEQFVYTIQAKSSEQKPGKSSNTIYVPLEKTVVTSTTHIPMLEMLGVEKSLIGFPHTDYISSEKTRAMIDNGQVQEIGNKADINTEVLLALNPEVVIGFSMSKTNKTLNLIERSGIPVILNGAWLEETPLGRAEWIKFFGLLYDKELEAEQIFNDIEANYLAVKEIAMTASSKPTILSGAVMSKDIWNLPAGKSFVAQFLTDANTNYLWSDTDGTGSLSISFESALDKGKDADFWIAPGYFTTKKQMLTSNEHYKEFTAFQKDQVFTFATKLGATGGTLYFELAPTRPDLVLKDIIKITHPELLKDYVTTFFEKLN
ncbi:ABC transporter substrate-binding protein [Polaribacter pacificus]|uniref:ABC transporter substrate-binding protein n=1 Tax=Polaribacter pacificus TaxID=1775173 RepID=A0A917HZH1_9FLAO|nr:ABC transporter substrate-binding protein [Polaribacter pacificus]GGG99168.1 ABC transporter substrate-binding protein [Polaribacter pacificus]